MHAAGLIEKRVYIRAGGRSAEQSKKNAAGLKTSIVKTPH